MSEPDYPPIPDKRRFTTGETCKLCLLESHTLRYWEQVFPQLAKVERRKNRRYYSKENILVLRHINNLKQQGLTTAAINKYLKGKPAKKAKQDKQVKKPAASIDSQIYAGDKIRAELQKIVKLLE